MLLDNFINYIYGLLFISQLVGYVCFALYV